MKKHSLFYLFAICGAFFMLFFIGCSQASNSGPDNPGGDDGKGFYIKNSRWQNVDIDTVKAIVSAKTGARSMSRAAVSQDFSESARSAETLTDTISLVETYNDVINDDQLFLFTEDVPVEESPFVDIYYVNEGDYADLGKVLGVERTEYIARYETYQLQASILGALLFVDKVPPVPIIPPETRTRHEIYHIQIVNKYGDIVVYNGNRYEESCEETWDNSHGIIPTFDFPSLDVYFESVKTLYNSQISNVGLVPPDTPWRVVSGEVYVKPEPEPVEE